MKRHRRLIYPPDEVTEDSLVIDPVVVRMWAEFLHARGARDGQVTTLCLLDAVSRPTADSNRLNGAGHR
jgi:hypothetical protein